MAGIHRHRHHPHRRSDSHGGNRMNYFCRPEASIWEAMVCVGSAFLAAGLIFVAAIFVFHWTINR